MDESDGSLRIVGSIDSECENKPNRLRRQMPPVKDLVRLTSILATMPIGSSLKNINHGSVTSASVSHSYDFDFGLSTTPHPIDPQRGCPPKYILTVKKWKPNNVSVISRVQAYSQSVEMEHDACEGMKQYIEMVRLVSYAC